MISSKHTLRFAIAIFLSVLPLVTIQNQSSYAQNFDSIDFEEIAQESKKESERIDALESKYLEHLEWSLDYEKSAYRWHLFSTSVIFFMVLLIVVSGLYFSYQQFKYSVLDPSRSRSESSLQENSNLKLGIAGLEVTSSVVGVLILVISLAFFYLYLENVYPISRGSNTGLLIEQPSLDDANVEAQIDEMQ